MKTRIEAYARRILARIQQVGAEVDPEILLLPGGSIIAALMWLFRKH